MNDQPVPQRSNAALAVAIIGTFLIVAVLVLAMRRQTQPPPVDQARIAERSKALVELRAAEAEALNTPAWIDQTKGLVRLPVTNAMDLVLRAWQNPEAARSNLIARVEKATAAPPKAPEKPSEFE